MACRAVPSGLFGRTGMIAASGPTTPRLKKHTTHDRPRASGRLKKLPFVATFPSQTITRRAGLYPSTAPLRHTEAENSGGRRGRTTTTVPRSARAVAPCLKFGKTTLDVFEHTTRFEKRGAQQFEIVPRDQVKPRVGRLEEDTRVAFGVLSQATEIFGQ